MRKRPTKSGQLRLVRTVYDADKYAAGNPSPKKEVTLGHISAACDPERLDEELRMKPGCVLLPEERAELLALLEANRAPHPEPAERRRLVSQALSGARVFLQKLAGAFRAVCGVRLGDAQQESSRSGSTPGAAARVSTKVTSPHPMAACGSVQPSSLRAGSAVPSHAAAQAKPSWAAARSCIKAATPWPAAPLRPSSWKAWIQSVLKTVAALLVQIPGRR